MHRAFVVSSRLESRIYCGHSCLSGPVVSWQLEWLGREGKEMVYWSIVSLSITKNETLTYFARNANTFLTFCLPAMPI